MRNLQSLLIFFFAVILWLISAADITPSFAKNIRIAQHRPYFPASPRTGKFDRNNFLTKIRTIDFTKPLKPCWSFLSNKIEADKIASDNGFGMDTGEYLFLPFFDGKVSAIDTSEAERIWETDLGGKIISNLSSDDKNLYVLSEVLYDENAKNNNDNIPKVIIRSLNKKSGLTEWQTNLKLTDFVNVEKAAKETDRKKDKKEEITENETNENCRMAIFKTSLIIYGENGSVISVNKNNGELLWRKNYESLFPDGSLLTNDHLILKTSEKILIISAETGDLIESFKQPEEMTNILYQPDKRRIIYSDDKGTVYFGILRNGTAPVIRKFRNGAEITNISLTRRGLLISSLDNFLYMLSEDNGELIWKRRLGGRISFKPLVEGDYAIVINTSEPVASVVELSTGKIVNKIFLENGDVFTGKPLKSGNKLLLTTQRGIFAFSDSNCPSSSE